MIVTTPGYEGNLWERTRSMNKRPDTFRGADCEAVQAVSRQRMAHPMTMRATRAVEVLH